MRYLTVADVAGFNTAEVGSNLLVEFGLLESAVLRPQTTLNQHDDAYPSIHEKAAALFHSLVKNHAFLDGNKRTAVIAVNVFYELNGMQLQMSQEDMIELAVDTATSELDVSAIAGLLKQGAVAGD